MMRADHAKEILAILQKNGGAGHGLPLGAVRAQFGDHRPGSELKQALEFAFNEGWVSQGPNTFVLLTEAGAKKIAAANQALGSTVAPTTKQKPTSFRTKMTGLLTAVIGVLGVALNWDHLDVFIERILQRWSPEATSLSCADDQITIENIEKFKTWRKQYVVPVAVDLTIDARAETGLYVPDLTVEGMQRINGVALRIFVDGSQCKEGENVTDQPVSHGGQIMSVEARCELKSLPAGVHVIRVEPTTVGSCDDRVTNEHCAHKATMVQIACSASKQN